MAVKGRESSSVQLIDVANDHCMFPVFLCVASITFIYNSFRATFIHDAIVGVVVVINSRKIPDNKCFAFNFIHNLLHRRQ